MTTEVLEPNFIDNTKLLVAEEEQLEAVLDIDALDEEIDKLALSEFEISKRQVEMIRLYKTLGKTPILHVNDRDFDIFQSFDARRIQYDY